MAKEPKVKLTGHAGEQFDGGVKDDADAFDRVPMSAADVKFGPGGRTARAFSAASTTLKKGCR